MRPASRRFGRSNLSSIGSGPLAAVPTRNNTAGRAASYKHRQLGFGLRPQRGLLFKELHDRILARHGFTGIGSKTHLILPGCDLEVTGADLSHRREIAPNKFLAAPGLLTCSRLRHREPASPHVSAGPAFDDPVFLREPKANNRPRRDGEFCVIDQLAPSQLQSGYGRAGAAFAIVLPAFKRRGRGRLNNLADGYKCFSHCVGRKRGQGQKRLVTCSPEKSAV